MNPRNPEDLSQFSMHELFRLEVESQVGVLTKDLLELEADPGNPARLEALMRAAHSLKGAAQIVNLPSGVRVAHAMEDCFVSAQQGALTLARKRIDVLLQGVDLLTRIAQTPEADAGIWQSERRTEVEVFLAALASPLETASEAVADPTAEAPNRGEVSAQEQQPEPGSVSGRALRVNAENLNRLLALAGESIVASRWLGSFRKEFTRLKRLQHELTRSLGALQESLDESSASERLRDQMRGAQRKTADCQQSLNERLVELESFEHRSTNLADRLYQEVLDCRMRPFAERIQGFPRMVRDLSRALSKEVRLQISGESTQVDRDILERIEAPLGHLLRNAVDHGLESPAERRQAGKPERGTVRLEARHSAGMLLITVADDGRGINPETLRQAIVAKKLTTAEVAEKMSDAELLDFLFLPGFTMKATVTDVSGRGVGLDAVQSMIKEVGGSIQVASQPGQGMHFQLKLPLTLSVLRALLVDIKNQRYAFPIARVVRVLKLSSDKIESIEGHQHFTFEEQQIGLVTAHQVLDLEEAAASSPELSVIVLGEKSGRYGLVVDRFLAELELVVRPLDPRLGKIKDISATALMPDRSPVLIVDVDDMIRSIEKLVSGGRLASIRWGDATERLKKRKRVLVVDDSLTVRELERKLLEGRGYQVELAVDGMDGWNAVRSSPYDLLITDVDMPRMDGIELVKLIKKDAGLSSLPVMIISYKDRPEDRDRGLEAGADYYLTKGSFHDESMIEAVNDLIGQADA